MMRSLSLFLVAFSSVLAFGVEPDPQWRTLFNGKNLDGWVNVNTAAETWQVRDGMIVCSGQPLGFLRTEGAFENYELELEWRHMAPKGNAGLMVHAAPLPQVGAPYPRSVEVQVMDGDGGSMFGIRGSKITPLTDPLWDPDRPRARPTEMRARPAGEWNSYRLVSQDGTLKLSVNGKRVTEATDATLVRGHICLESERSEVHFRNIRIRELPGSNPPAEKVADKAHAYSSLFDGLTLRGWKKNQAIEGRWQVRNGVIRLPVNQPPRKRGVDDHLWTEQDYKDFILIADWRLTERPQRTAMNAFTNDGLLKRDADGHQVKHEIMHAGDSGIILRGDQKAQVNIWSQPMGSGDINPYHKDASLPLELRQACLPMVHADESPRQWNRFEIHLKDEHISVILNGTRVIDHAHLPGIAASGPIGLQNHGDGIEFDNLYIRPYPNGGTDPIPKQPAPQID